MKDVKVYAQNLRSYNIGLDQGRWITLGIEEQELQRILTEQLHLTKNHPDMAIFDYQADFEISEYEDIYELNQAVAQLKQLPEQDYEKVMDYCDARDITSPLEISNVCLQADEVPYERFPDWIDENVKDPEEKLGYALFENNSLAPEIKAAGMEGYFDYKAYGRDEAINSYDIGDHGFVNKRISITSSNNKIVTVTGNKNGTCKIKAGSKTGKATITIKLASGLTKQIKVTVQKKAVTCTAIKNVSKKLTLNKKKSYQLKPVINPITCTNKIKYKSSNKKIAKVSSTGKITAIKPGKVKITISVGKKKFVSNVIIKK